MNENEKVMLKKAIDQEKEDCNYALHGVEGFIEAIKLINPDADIRSLELVKTVLNGTDSFFDLIKKEIDKPCKELGDDKLRQALEEAKTFIVYAASELQEGKASITNGDQFPKKEDAKIMIQKLEALL